MGVLGSYMSTEEELFDQIVSGEDESIAPENYQHLDIDKSWQLIHFLLCKNLENGEPPMGYVVPMRDENELDLGQTDARIFYITAQQAREAADYLNTLSDNDLKDMYDFEAMEKNGVYQISKGEKDTGWYEYIYSHLTEIRKFYAQAAEKGHAISFTVC